jgi:hypothetical protein
MHQDSQQFRICRVLLGARQQSEHRFLRATEIELKVRIVVVRQR